MARLGRSQPTNVVISDDITGSSSVSGSLAVTLADVTCAAAGSSVTGSLARTLAGVTCAGSGTSTGSTSGFSLTIEWLPDGTPNDEDGTWEPMTAYVASGSIKRGRQYELDRFQAGAVSLTLKTTTRLFDSEYAAGAYYGKLLPMRQIRITAIYNSIIYAVWRGFVTSWGTTAQDDALFVTTITAKDGFERLERVRLPSSAWALEIVKDDPTAWFRLGETDTPRLTDSSPNGNYGLYDNCQQGAQGLVKNDADGAVSFAHSLEERVVIQNPNLITGYPFTISFMFQIDNNEPTGFKGIFVGWPNIPSTAAGFVQIFLGYQGGTTTVGSTTAWISDGTNSWIQGTKARFDDNQPHHCEMVFTSGNNWTFYLDGAAALSGAGSSGSGNPSFPPAPSNWTIGNYPDLLSGDWGFGTNDPSYFDTDGTAVFPLHARGTIDEFCVWNGTVITPTRVAAHSVAALTGWEGDMSGARITRFLDAINWPSGLRDIETGISILGPANWSLGASALSVMQGWADTELGQFFMGKDGKIVWRSRHHPLLDATAVTSQATFGDGHSSATCQYDNNGLSQPKDETMIRNPVFASRTDGVTVVAQDNDLIENVYGDRTWVAPGSEDQKDSVVHDRANWILSRYKDEHTRLESMTISPQRDPDNLWPQVLGREIGERVTVKRTPAGMGTESVIDFILEGVEHTFGVDELWKTTFNGSPVDPGVGTYLILDDPTYGLIQADGTYTVVAATDVFTFSDSGGIANGTAVVLSSITGSTGVVAGTTYYVVSSSGATFKLSATFGGSAVNITADGAGVCQSATLTTAGLLAY